MALTIKQECPGCQHFMKTGDFFHDKETWDRYHNSGWVDGKSDWQPREEIQDTLDRMKRIWEKTMALTNSSSEINDKVVKAIIKFEEMEC